MWLLLIQTIVSPVFDLCLFYQITKQKYRYTDIFLIVLFVGLSFGDASGYINEFVADLLEILIITFYFKISRKSKDIKIFVGSALIFGLVDLFCSIVTTIFGAGLNLRSNNIYLLSLVLEVAFVLLIVMNKDCIYNESKWNNFCRAHCIYLYFYNGSLLFYS